MSASKVITNTNTHGLKEGDVVLNNGVYFVLSNRKVWPMRKDDNPVTQGECITFTGTPIAEVENHNFPRHWMKDYSFQGNKMATWAVVSAE